MSNFIQTFNNYPGPVRATFQTFVVAWVWLLFSLYRYFLQGDVPVQFVAIGAMLFISLVLFKNWGRVLSAVFNVLAILFFLWLSAHYYYAGKSQLITMALLNVAFFTISTRYLLNRETKAFFLKMTAEKDQQNVSIREDAPRPPKKGASKKSKHKTR